MFAATVGGIGAAGYIPVGNKHVWDYYVSGLRHLEEYSPAGMFKTFQLSNIFSPFTTPARAPLLINPELLANNPHYANYLAKLIGERPGRDAFGRLISEGVSFRQGRLYWGAGQEVALQHASILLPSSKSQIGAAYARRLGAVTRGIPWEKFFTSPVLNVGTKFEYQNPVVGEQVAQVIGGRNWAEHTWRKFGALGTEQIERFNRLLRSPFEVQPFKGIFGGVQESLAKNFGIKNIFSVKQAGGLEMLGRMSLKYGAGLGALALGYGMADWAVRRSSLFDETAFDKGITHGIATMGVKAHITASEISQATGLQAFARKQEEIAPGSTDLLKLAAFPAMGALGAVGAFYGYKVAKMAQLQFGQQLSSSVARKTVEESLKDWSKLGPLIQSAGEKVNSIRLFKSLKPRGALALVGAALGLATTLPFLPGALIPQESPDKLKRIYSGEEYVPIRKGRWWELGRCLTKSTTCKLFNGETRLASEVQTGDVLVGKDFRPAVVKKVYQRLADEAVYEFSTAFDREITTTLTGNHIVPVLRNSVLCEVAAEDIRLNEFVEIPYKRLQGALSDIDCLDFIHYPVFVDDEHIFSVQRNRGTGKRRRSGTHYLDRRLILDYDLGLFIGYFLAEGNIGFRGETPHLIETVHSVHELTEIRNLLRIAEEKFHLQGTVRYKCDGPKSKEGCYVVRFCSSILAKLFIGLFFNQPYLAEEKRVPAILDTANSEFKAGLIEGYWRGDGKLDGNYRIIDSTRKWLLTTTQSYALSLGSPCGIGPKEENGFKGDWHLRFSPKDGGSAGNVAVRFVEGRLYARIRSIKTYQYNDTVYDFEVDDSDHLFQAGTFLVHNSNIRGGDIAYYRPHAYALATSRARERSIWGTEEDELNPISKWWKSEFTYSLEEKHALDRPYPKSAVPFSDVPLVGPLLSATLGKWIKPTVYYRTDEWVGEKGVRLAPKGFGGRTAPELGESPGGVPVNAQSFTQVLGEQIYRLGTELPGLTGFAAASVKEKLTGSQDWFDQRNQLADAGRIAGYEREYWDKELGGLATLSEPWRRLFPHRRRQIGLENPLRNQMPSWMNLEGDRGPQLNFGDPFGAIPMGDIRLPGAGFETLHPELQGVDPEDYPAAYRHSILADVALYSDKHKEALAAARKQRASGDWSAREEEIYQRTLAQTKQRKRETPFREYKYLSPMGDITSNASGETTELLSTINEWKASQIEKPSLAKKLFGGYWELLSHNAETSLDVLTPVSPGAKLVHERSAIESYEREVQLNTATAFWNKPIEDFVKPFIRRTTQSLGYEGTPSDIERMRSTEDYFDKLKYVKYARLSNMARMAEDTAAVKEFEQKKDETMFGLNPYTRNYTSIYRALPGRERDYLDAFENVETAEERQKILSMVPENEQALYQARWRLAHAEDLKRAMRAGVLSDRQEEEAQQEIDTVRAEGSSEGFPTSQELTQEYWATKYKGENYGDWYRRTKLLPQEGRIPGADFTGFHGAFDLEDVKLKIVQQMGDDPIKYNLWPSRDKDMAYRQGAVQEATEQLQQTSSLAPEEMKSRLSDLLFVDKMKGDTFVSTVADGKGRTSLNLQVVQNTDEEEKEQVLSVLNG